MYVQVQISTVTYCARFSKQQPPKGSEKECNGIAAALTMAEEEDVWCALLYHDDDGGGATEKGGIGPASRRRRSSKGFRTRNNNSNNNLALLHTLKVHCIEYCTVLAGREGEQS